MSRRRSPSGVLAELIAEPWAMEPAALAAFVEMLYHSAGGSDAAAPGHQAAGLASAPESRARLAVIPIAGPILKRRNWMLDAMGVVYTAVGDVVRGLSAALADESAGGIVLWLDSPGGQVGGVQELADAIAGVAEQKPITAFVSDVGLSAAYWLASQASGGVYANAAAQVGSIGVYTVVVDSSGAAEKCGVKVHVVGSGGMKGARVDGTHITEEQLADVRRIVDGLAGQFVGAVARGRGLELGAVEALATGQVWLAEEARGKGLLDGVMNWAEFLPRVAAGEFGASGPQAQTGESVMEIKTVEELSAAHPELCKELQERAAGVGRSQGADDGGKAVVERAKALQAAFAGRAEFVLGCLIAGDGVAAAQAKLVPILEAEKAALAAENVKLGEELKKKGAAPVAFVASDVEGAAGAGGDAAQPFKSWTEMMTATMSARGIDKLPAAEQAKARSQLAREMKKQYPDLM